jgi:pyruvate kinase
MPISPVTLAPVSLAPVTLPPITLSAVTLSAAELLSRVEALREAVLREGAETCALWSSLLPRRAAPAAHNLACYLALRRHDISALQASLSQRGLSSLGRSEAHVVASLDALRATLARLAGAGAPPFPAPGRMEAGGRALARARDRFFGEDVIGARTRIMATLPTAAAADRGLVRALLAAGMTAARINCAHDDADTWREMAAAVREEAAALGRPCRVLMDLGGPKNRIETVHAAGAPRLFRGDRVALVSDLAHAAAEDRVIITPSEPALLEGLAPGREVWVNDGKIGLRVAAIDAGRVVLEVVHARSKGERLRPGKGLNFPGTELRLAAPTAQDLADLDTAATLADCIGFSFVQRPEDVARLAAALAERRPLLPPMPLVLKIETPLAVRNLPRLLVQAAAAGPVAVMIARGDLAVELGFSRLSEVQEEIMWLCEAARVPVIWATQVLDTLVSEGRPSRAEATDAAMAQRAECVMLNKGPFLPEGIAFLADVLRRMDRHQEKKTALFGQLQSWPREELGFGGDAEARAAVLHSVA